MKRTIAVLVLLAVLAMSAVAYSASAFVPGSRVLRVTEVSGGVPTTVIAVAGPSDRVRLTRTELRVVHTDGSAEVVGLRGFRRLDISQSK